MVYLDDILVIAPSRSQCHHDIRQLVALLLRLGFVINLAKSELAPTQQKVFLGTLIDSLTMQFFLPGPKLIAFKKRITAFLKKAVAGEEAHLREIQSIVGTIGATAECVTAVRLRLNALIEMQNRALHSKSGKILLGEEEVHKAHKFFMDDPTHINERELLAAEYGLQAFTRKLGWKGKSIRIRTDNTVALSYLNKMGGRVPSLSRIAERIHSFALKHELVLSAEWIPSDSNQADKESRIEGDLSDWMLNPQAFALVVKRFGRMLLDLFASNQNAQTPLFVSLKADPEAHYVDAFSRKIPHGLQVFANPPSS